MSKNSEKMVVAASEKLKQTQAKKAELLKRVASAQKGEKSLEATVASATGVSTGSSSSKGGAGHIAGTLLRREAEAQKAQEHLSKVQREGHAKVVASAAKMNKAIAAATEAESKRQAAARKVEAAKDE